MAEIVVDETMIVLDEESTWEDEINGVGEETDALGGQDGPDNVSARQLANRTSWLKDAFRALTESLANYAGNVAVRFKVADAVEDDEAVSLGQLKTHSGFGNILVNGDMRVNRREFDGNYASIEVGEYGYDRWRKYSTTEIVQPIEEINYKPSTMYTLSGINVPTTQIQSPESGIWEVVALNTATEVQLEEGKIPTKFKKPGIQFVQMQCDRYYRRSGTPDSAFSGAVMVIDLSDPRGQVTWSTPMRVIPSVTVLSPVTKVINKAYIFWAGVDTNMDLISSAANGITVGYYLPMSAKPDDDTVYAGYIADAEIY